MWIQTDCVNYVVELISMILRMSIISYYVVTHIMILETNIYHLLYVQRKVS